MNYEEFYETLAPLEKRMRDAAAAAQKSYKAIAKATESGDVKAINKELAGFSALAQTQTEIAGEIQALVDAFDTKSYFEGGEFAEQMLDCCKAQNVDIQGEYPVFEIFPYRVRIDAENQDLYLDMKKVSCMRPSFFVNQVKSSQERLMKAPFNAQTFLNELSDAYDMAVLKQKKQDGADLYLTGLYKFLVPMSRSRKEYDLQSFAYDLARLYSSETETTKSGRRFQFGPSRNNNKAIRILDADGKEQFLATIRFFD